MSAVNGEKGISVARQVIKVVMQTDCFKAFVNKVNILTAGNGNIKAEFTVDDEMVNVAGTLHGGCAAAMIDSISSIGLMTSKIGSPGVSVNLNINYMKSAKIGQQIILESNLVKLGRTLAFLDVKLINKETGDVVVNGSHVKHIGG